jgi:hypothetical protein
MKSKTIICIQCDRPFYISPSEQEYFTAKGFDEPTRCPECRKRKIKWTEEQAGKKGSDKKKTFRRRDQEEWDH